MCVGFHPPSAAPRWPLRSQAGSAAGSYSGGAGEIIPASAAKQTWLYNQSWGDWVGQTLRSVDVHVVTRRSAGVCRAAIPLALLVPGELCASSVPGEERVVPGMSFYSSSASISSCKWNFLESGANSAGLRYEGDGE